MFREKMSDFVNVGGLYALPDSFTIEKRRLDIPTRRTRTMEKILEKMAEEFGYFQLMEYSYGNNVWVDWVWFEKDNNEPQVAIEHENKPDKGLDMELKNLASSASARLRILITYNIGEGSEVFEFLKDEIKTKINLNNCEFVLVVGNDEMTEWKGYKFDINGYSEI